MTFQKRKGRATFSYGKRGPRASYRLGCLVPMTLTLTACLLLIAACSSPAPAAPQDTFVPIVPSETLAPLYGTGKITFGADVDPDTLEIIKPNGSFRTSSKKIAWSASLTESVDATSITWILSKTSASGVESVLFKEEHDIANPDSDTLANSVDLAFLLDRKAGTYVMRYLREGDVLAEGKFNLVK